MGMNERAHLHASCKNSDNLDKKCRCYSQSMLNWPSFLACMHILHIFCSNHVNFYLDSVKIADFTAKIGFQGNFRWKKGSNIIGAIALVALGKVKANWVQFC